MVKNYSYVLLIGLLGFGCTNTGDSGGCDEWYEVEVIEDGQVVSRDYICGQYDPASTDHSVLPDNEAVEASDEGALQSNPTTEQSSADTLAAAHPEAKNRAF
ncbi:hypothetical protein SAMN04488030_1551 [Aliiroseovarius halocynthiae]|uniref:Uncharacterized protein n=1 Tax=Aliiroseovarius halocynthiae TaxID=985055 RepID=A0A545SWU0_9RHOB|nr:hypothetical protein [Aliiroseovarius halocynthiae]TQV69414.1 hypothetical protein FIL88_07670 [Aliiroseovarius halocynthiae]SMR72807.1 hypothetical protein SAMN04488030_1551 [Aliiroseovarius halocynthiae]